VAVADVNLRREGLNDFASTDLFEFDDDCKIV